MDSLPIRGRNDTSATNHSTPDQDMVHPAIPCTVTSSPAGPPSLSYGHDDAQDPLSRTISSSHPLRGLIPSEQDQDSCSDHFDYSPPSPFIGSSGPSETSSSDESDNSTRDFEIQHLLPLPTSSPGYLTHSHQQAMANRVTYDKLLPDGVFETTKYTPVFLHDTLMLPGSLANVLGKDSSLDILDRLTPARLPSFTVLPHHTPPHQPCLLPFASPSSPVTGLLFLGSGRRDREAIKAHYRPVAKRVRHKVVIEVSVPVPRSERKMESEKWRLEARWVEAQVFRWRGARDERKNGWELGEAVWGAYGSGVEEMEIVTSEDWGRREVDESEGRLVDARELELDGRSEWAGDVKWAEGRAATASDVEW